MRPFTPSVIKSGSLVSGETETEGNGTYRVTVTPEGQTLVTVRSGHADIDSPRGPQSLDPGRTLIAEGPATDPNIQLNSAVVFDDFDAFNEARDQVHQRVASAAPYVNPNIAGVEDLPSYGRWDNDPSYGHVWVPNNVPPNWAPYQDGSWAWEDAYGWTWVAAEPWGWAPYHYGRWYHSPVLGWAWCPPAPGVFVPAWSPALVGFIGFGTTIGAVNVGIGFGFGNIGWVPLAPGEPFNPWWGRRAVNVTNINITNVNVYRNAVYPNAFTSVTSQRFLQGDFRSRQSLSAAQLRNEHVVAVRGGLGIVPSAANLRFSSRPFEQQQLAYRPAPQAFAGHANVTMRTPFESQRQALATSYHVTAPVEHFGPPATARFAAPQTNAQRFAQREAPASVRPEAAPAAAAGFAGRGGDPWTRFSTGRGMTAGSGSYVRPQTQAPAYARPQTQPQPTYVRPSGSDYARPQTQYQQPTYSRGGYNQPQAQGQPTYTRPSGGGYVQPQAQGQPAYTRPSGGGYVRPQVQAQPTYTRPSGGGYVRPQTQAPPAYARPSGGGYARPQPQAQPAYSRPAGGGNSRPAPSSSNSSDRSTGRDRSTR